MSAEVLAAPARASIATQLLPPPAAVAGQGLGYQALWGGGTLGGDALPAWQIMPPSFGC